jgi:decaprenyl-diphosphate synthase subunit 2
MSLIFKQLRASKVFCNIGKRSIVKQCSAKYISTSSVNEQSTQNAPKVDFQQAIVDAGKLVGYKSDFSTLRWLFKDDILNFELHIKKLVETNHPLLDTVRNLKNDGKYNMQSWELIVLLLSKCAIINPNSMRVGDESIGILRSQRILSQVTEMIRTAHYVHGGMINFQSLNVLGKGLGSDDVLMLGNKLSLLSGDYLLGTASAQIASLKDHDLNILISSALRDLAEAACFGETDEQNIPLPFDPAISAQYKNKATADFEHSDEIDNLKPITIRNFMENPEKEWALRNILGTGSLLGKSCQGAMMVADMPERLQKVAYLFGKYLALSWQAWIDLDPYKTETLPEDTTFSLVSAPVLFHLDYDPSLYQEIIKGRNSVKNIDFQKVHKMVLSGPAVEKTKELQRKYSFIARTALDEFQPSEARSALKNIIQSLTV